MIDVESADGGPVHLSVELLAAVLMAAAVALEIGQLRRLMLREAHLTRAVSAASGALHDLMERWFEEWGLTPSEQDVAAFAIKGMEIAEIARLRGTAEGTVKAQLGAIYRKAGVAGRPGLVSLLIEDLMQEPLVADPARPREENVAKPRPIG